MMRKYQHSSRTVIAIMIAAALWSHVAMGESNVQCALLRATDSLSQQASDYLSRQISGPRTILLFNFYKPCGYALAWTHGGSLTGQARSMIQQLETADTKGLRPSDYGISLLEKTAQSIDTASGINPATLADFDASLTVGAMRYVSDLVYGRARPLDIKAGYSTRPDTAYLASVIWSQIVTSNDVPTAIQQLEPMAPGYLRTETALRALLAQTRSTPQVALPAFPGIIYPGNSSSCLPALIDRLKQLDELPMTSGVEQQPAHYTGRVVDAVRHFQATHGLKPTGTIDRVTWINLTTPLSERITQLSLTLERWRWVPHTFTEPPIVVNIPEYRVRAYDEQLRVALSMAIIVGSAANRKTPVLQATITQVIFHPYWNVPRTIQIREIAPHVVASSQYLTAHAYQVVAPNGTVVHTVDADTIRGIKTGTFRIRQTPSSQNALGVIKFTFPNPFNVYMHGTPQQSLFQQSRRDFSHGCIRVEDPASLAAWVLRRQDGWSRERVLQSIQDPKTISVTLSHPIPVLVVYGTGFAAEDGGLRFFDDSTDMIGRLNAHWMLFR